MKPVVLVPAAVEEQGLGLGRAAGGEGSSSRCWQWFWRSGGGSGAGQGKQQRCSRLTRRDPSIQYGSLVILLPRQKSRDPEGTVYVKMLVSSGGSVECFLLHTSWQRLMRALDGAAVETVYNWVSARLKIHI